MFRCNFRWLVVCICGLIFAEPATGIAADTPDFNADIRPILATYCWKCHGVDAALHGNGVRFDQEHLSRSSSSSGTTPIVPGSPETSEIIRRLQSTDPEIQMPPADQVSRPSLEDVRKLDEWIRGGAKFEQHWSFSPPTRPPIPEGTDQQNPVDAFVLARLQSNGLTFSPVADRATLLRRLSLDITGLPPDQKLLEQANAPWEQLIDQVLASPHFGERMASDWLDAARYADTNGYFGDKPRQIWLWRDWVINAFNANMPFDQFTIEQIAGDLLPEPTVASRIATGFNRNHVANNETGIIDEEFRVEYVADRVSTTMATWMGLTAGCAQCHDHKYDPVSQKDYYSLFAFFNNVPETGLITTDNPPPILRVTTAEQDLELARLATVRAQSESVLATTRVQLAERMEAFLVSMASAGPASFTESMLTHAECEGSGSENWEYQGTPVNVSRGIRGQAIRFDGTQHLVSSIPEFHADQPWTLGFWFYPEGTLSCPVSMVTNDNQRRGLEVLWQNGRISVDLIHQWGVSSIGLLSAAEVGANNWHHVAVDYDGGQTPDSLKLYVDGHLAVTTSRGLQLGGSIDSETNLLLGRRQPGPGTYGLLDEFQLFTQNLTPDQVAQWVRRERLIGIAERERTTRTADEQEFLFRDFVENECDEDTRTIYRAVQTSQLAEKRFAGGLPVTLVMEELPTPRVTHILERGQYDQPGAIVSADVPEQFGPWPPNAPRNRLGLARWIVSSQNPLTARVAVNRLWKICFGEGLVRTQGDFGVQGSFPTHPELLDWLAVRYQESGWDTKALLKLILSSRTYRQSSTHLTETAIHIDPQNRLLWRAPTYRLTAEMIRDQALAVSDLLCRDIGGPSVKPYQPEGLWEEVSYNGEDTYVTDDGTALYRRSLYTFIKRQSPPPALLIFDGPTREKCSLQRATTNTPLQALVVLNDPTYIEAARVLAGSIRSHGAVVLPLTVEQQIRLAFTRILNREPSNSESTVLLNLFDQQQVRFAEQPLEAEHLLGVGATPRQADSDQAGYAALTVVVHTILNLDETVTRR